MVRVSKQVNWKLILICHPSSAVCKTASVNYRQQQTLRIYDNRTKKVSRLYKTDAYKWKKNNDENKKDVDGSKNEQFSSRKKSLDFIASSRKQKPTKWPKSNSAVAEIQQRLACRSHPKVLRNDFKQTKFCVVKVHRKFLWHLLE